MTTAERVAERLNARPQLADWWEIMDAEDPTYQPDDYEFGTVPGDQATFPDGSVLEYHPGHFGGDWVPDRKETTR